MAERIAPQGNPEAALEVLIAHYERRGEVALAMLADDIDPRAARMNNAGRLAHREWVEQVFTDRLPATVVDRARLVDVLVVATDVYAWKLLRLDRGLPVHDVADRMLLMTEALLAGARTP
jgi:predicted acylesterase/phospholipase RssA